jgi:hypothetical protein
VLDKNCVIRSIIIFTLHQILLGFSNQVDDVGEAYSMHGKINCEEVNEAIFLMLLLMMYYMKSVLYSVTCFC